MYISSLLPTTALLLSLIPQVAATGRGNNAGSSKAGGAASTHKIHGIPVEGCSPDQIKKLEKAIAGVNTVADFAHGHLDPDSTAWTNYFRLQSDAAGFKADKRFALAQWQQAGHIANANREYKFKIVCLKEKDPKCHGGSEAFTDSSPADSTTKAQHKQKGKDKAAAKAAAAGKTKRSAEEDEDEVDEPEHELYARGKKKKTSTRPKTEQPPTEQPPTELPVRTKPDNNAGKDKKRPKESSSEPSGSDADKKKKDKPKSKKGRKKSPDRETPDDNLPALNVCPAFFKKPALQDLELKPSAGESSSSGRPSRNKPKGLCDKDTLFKSIDNMSHTIFHEITHLHAFARAAKISESKGKSSGSVDYNYVTSYVKSARHLAKIWQTNQRSGKTIPPFRNAENVAASALEAYYLNRCELPPTHKVPLDAEDVTAAAGLRR